jgi:hypothetical protein
MQLFTKAIFILAMVAVMASSFSKALPGYGSELVSHPSPEAQALFSHLMAEVTKKGAQKPQPAE